MPSGFNFNGMKKDKDKGADANAIDNEFLVQQIGRTNQMLEQLTQLQATQMQIQQQMMQAQQTPSKKDEPVKPPDEFDITQIHDPNTESGKFFQSLLEKRDEKLKDSLLNEFKTALQEKEFERDLDRRFNSLKDKFEVDDETLNGFREWVQKPDGAELDVLFEVYNKVTSSDDDKNSIGTPSGIHQTSGGGNNPPDDEGGFLSGLK